MRIFLAGSTGAVGRRLVPVLVGEGHEVYAMVRTPDRTPAVEASGAVALVGDGLDGDSVRRAVAQARPEVVVHHMTALKRVGNPRNFDRDFATTNRLRTEGTRHLLAAARAAGARRLIAQSFAGWPFAREGGPVKDEDAPLDPRPQRGQRRSLAAIRELEAMVVGGDGVEGVVLRLGPLYGPGTSPGPAARTSSSSAAAASRSSAPAPACGRSATSTTRSARPSPRSSAATRASSTSSTTIRLRSPAGCPSSRARSARRPPAASRAGWGSSPSAASASR
jgi:nucleoside-diphosphate-sugar epimerase